jgi:2-polyprenyl-3-methyl-5-hydroxy-6-metoxy-1,4-benzoquinol methylase
MLDTTFNQQKAEAFAAGLIDTLNKSALALALSIGHRTGLFDALAGLPFATSARIAEAAGLDERYVREWLGAMVTGRVVAYDAENRTYKLPDEHAAFLTRAATPNNFAATMQFVPLLGAVEDKILECFRRGGGLPYEEFPRFHEVMAEESGQTVVAALLDKILPLVPGIREKLDRGIDVLDVGCGSGRALVLLARTFPRSRFTGYDFSAEAIENAAAEARRAGLENLRFAARDAAALGETERYDLITAFDAIHDQARPDAVLRGIFDALRADGTFLMQDIKGSSHVHLNLDHPISTYLYTISYTHCMSVSLADGGAGLGTMWGEEKACEMLREAGFEKIGINYLDHDPVNTYYVVGKGKSEELRGEEVASGELRVGKEL